MATLFVRYFSHGPRWWRRPVRPSLACRHFVCVPIPPPLCRGVDNVEWTDNENFPHNSQRRPFLETVRHGFIASLKSPCKNNRVSLLLAMWRRQCSVSIGNTCRRCTWRSLCARACVCGSSIVSGRGFGTRHTSTWYIHLLRVYRYGGNVWRLFLFISGYPKRPPQRLFDRSIWPGDAHAFGWTFTIARPVELLHPSPIARMTAGHKRLYAAYMCVCTMQWIHPSFFLLFFPSKYNS